MKTNLIKTSKIRNIVKSHDKRVSAAFLQALDRHVHEKIMLAIQTHNGSKKTIDEAVAAYIFGNK